MSMPCRVLLVGMMGSGKTSVGRALSRLVGWRHLDNDELLEAATGQTAAELARAGEATIREAESRALRAALREDAPIVAGIAAGAVLDPADRRALAGAGLVVWLRADPAVLARRVAGSTHRPWLDDDPEDWLRRTNDERTPLYAEVAGMTVQTDVVQPPEVAERIAERLRTNGCLPGL